jgi:SAM-dependent methyltransferase
MDSYDTAFDLEPPIYGEPIGQCVACAGIRIEKWRDKAYSYTDKRNGSTFSIFKCLECGTGFLNPPPHRKFLESIYAYSGHALQGPVLVEAILDRERQFPNSTVDARRLARVSQERDRSGSWKALDVGSGYGFFTKELRAAGYDTVSINPGQYENAIFVELNGDAPQAVMFERYEPDCRFGVVLMSQVLEHIVQPSDAIAKAARLLEPGGVLACAVPNFRSLLVFILGTKDNSCLWVPEHVNYFTEEGLTKLFQRHGLTVTHREYVTRVRPDALSSRMALAGASPVLEVLVRYGQLPVAWLANAIGRGSYINLYASRP